MSKTHWKKLNNPDFLGAYALEPGKDMVLTIASVKEESFTGQDGKKDTGIICRFVENVKPMILNSTNSKTISKIYNTPYVEDWVGKKIQIHSAMIKAFGDVVEGLRIRPFVPQVEKPICEDCGNEVTGYGTYTAQQIAQRNSQKYGATLCVECAAKRKNANDVLGGISKSEEADTLENTEVEDNADNKD